MTTQVLFFDVFHEKDPHVNAVEYFFRFVWCITPERCKNLQVVIRENYRLSHVKILFFLTGVKVN